MPRRISRIIPHAVARRPTPTLNFRPRELPANRSEAFAWARRGFEASWNHHPTAATFDHCWSIFGEKTCWQRWLDHDAADTSRDAIQQRQSGQGVLAPGLGRGLDPDRYRFDPRSPCHLRSDIWPQPRRGHTRWVPAD